MAKALWSQNMNLNSKTPIGWIDTVVQLRDLSPAELEHLEIQLTRESVVALVSAGFSPSRDLVRRTLPARNSTTHVYHAWGLHPLATDISEPARWSDEVKQLKPSFIGELGLDKRCLATLDWNQQLERAELGLELAKEFRLPLIWHSVHATQRSLELIATATRWGGRGVWHGFHGSVETAKRLVAWGWKIGVGPNLLRPESHRLRDVVRALSLDVIMLESDWPQPQRSYQLARLGEEVAALFKVPVEAVQAQLVQNFFDLVEKS